MKLTQEQLEQFDREGYLFLPNLFSTEQADTLQESISTRVFGTSMSAHHILGLEQVPRVWLFAN